MSKKIKVYCGFLSNGVRADAQEFAIRDIMARAGDKVELVYPPVLCRRIFHDFARNAVADDFLESDCDVLWFLDSDVVPPKHLLELITIHYDKWQAAGACYPLFINPPGEEAQQIVFTAYKGNGERGIAPSTIPYSGTDFVDGLATGCLFIKREVFAQLQKPYFEFKYNPETREPIEGEDLGFAMKCGKLGIKFFTDYSMVCKHYKNNLDLLDLNNYAISYAQKAVNAYADGVKEQIAIAEERIALAEEIMQKMVACTDMNTRTHVTKSGLILPKGLT